MHEAASIKTWGPFSGRQLTTMVVALIVSVAVPVGAFAAVAGSNVFIADATSGARAKVDSAGNVQAKVNSGSVTATRAPTNQFFRGGDIDTLWVSAYGYLVPASAVS